MDITYSIYKEAVRHKYSSEPHFHDEYEVLFGLTDGGTYLINGKPHPLCHAMLFVLNKHVVHQCVANTASYDKFVLHFSSDTLKSLSSPQTDFEAIFRKLDYIAMLLNESQFQKLSDILHECLPDTKTFGGDIRQSMAFLNLLLYLSNLIEQQIPGVEPVPEQKYSNIKPIFDYIHNHYMDELSLEDLSRQFYISKYYLCRQFKAMTGFSIGSYVTNYRIREASILLRKGYSVQRAGEEVGFNNNAYFIKTFKKIVGTSPGKYAKNSYSNC